MPTYSRPTRENYEEFLIQVVYGPCTDYLTGCIKASYLDFCRTMRGFAESPNRNATYHRALTTLLDRFRTLANSADINNQSTFDTWHKAIINELIVIFRESAFEIFVGQAQKWINMTFKNSFVCGSVRIPGLEKLYDFCHMPIDNVVLDALVVLGVTRTRKAWSRWNYEDYFSFQQRLRAMFGNQPLLNVEHELWLRGR